MLNRLLSAFRRPSAPPPPDPIPAPKRASFGAQSELPPIHAISDEPVPRYPERSPLVPAVSPAVLLETQKDTIERLRQSLGSTRPEFAEWVEPVLLRYTERVHLLPASESDHHCGRGGMLRHGLEAAFFAARLAEGKVYAFDALAADRKTLDPKWRLATVLAALLHDLGKIVVDVNAVDESGAHTWSGHGASLWDWLQRHRLQGYYIYWRPGARAQRHNHFGPVLLREVIGGEVLEHLSANGGHEIVNKLILAFTHPDDKTNPIAELANQADRRSADFDLEDQATRIAAAGGSPLRSHAGLIVRAMSQLVDDGTWNLTKAGPLIHTRHGLFGIVPEVFSVPVARLREEGQLKGFPGEARQMVELMLRFHVLEELDGRALWVIRVKTGSATSELSVVKFAHPEHVLGAHDATPPLEAEVVDRSAAAAPAQPARPAVPEPAAAPPPEGTPAPGEHATAAPLALAAGQGGEPTHTAAAPAEPVGDAAAPRGQDAVMITDIDRATAIVAKVIADLTPHNASNLWMRGILQRFLKGELRWQRDAVLVDGRALLAYPTAFSALGMPPAELRDQLHTDGWVDLDAISQRLVVDVTGPTGPFKGCYTSEQLLPTWQTLSQQLPLIHPQLDADDAAAGSTSAVLTGIRLLPTLITGAQVGKNLRAVSRAVEESLKHQICVILQERRLHKSLPPKASRAQVDERRKRLAQVMAEQAELREIPKKSLWLLLSSTVNPLLTTVSENGKDHIAIHSDYTPLEAP